MTSGAIVARGGLLRHMARARREAHPRYHRSPMLRGAHHRRRIPAAMRACELLASYVCGMGRRDDCAGARAHVYLGHISGVSRP